MAKLLVPFIVLLLLPVAEVSLLLEVYRASANAWGPGAGLLTVLGLLIGAALLGVALIRFQGLLVLHKLRAAAAHGESPSHALMDGALILIGGVLLLIPGLLTDLIGLTMCLPGTRQLWRVALLAWIRGKVREGTVMVLKHGNAGRSDSGPRPDHTVIDITPRAELEIDALDEPGRSPP